MNNTPKVGIAYRNYTVTESRGKEPIELRPKEEGGKGE